MDLRPCPLAAVCRGWDDPTLGRYVTRPKTSRPYVVPAPRSKPKRDTRRAIKGKGSIESQQPRQPPGQSVSGLRKQHSNVLSSVEVRNALYTVHQPGTTSSDPCLRKGTILIKGKTGCRVQKCTACRHIAIIFLLTAARHEGLPHDVRI